MRGAADTLAEWATAFEPSPEDLALAERALRDTVAVMYAAREHPLRSLFDHLGAAGRLSALAHVLDYDDLHMASTAHISAVCVPAVLASNGDARAYLAGAGVMARLGAALGWRHYQAGWHATCTAGAPAAAVAAAQSRGLDQDATATAIALAIPAAGGVQRAFGTVAKSLQVGFAADAGVRAAALAEAGATADPTALDQWIALVNGDPVRLNDPVPEAVPGGLAIKLFPCCYALQRPISALTALPHLPAADHIEEIRITTPASSLAPLIHRTPTTGLEGKFSLEYAIAATLLDRRPDLQSFTDAAVNRPEARALLDRVHTTATETGEGLLAGEFKIELEPTNGGDPMSTSLTTPPGAPARPPSDDELREKIETCAGAAADEIATLTWDDAASTIPRLSAPRSAGSGPPPAARTRRG